jgi:Na+:H+ antiporter, NhaC family
MPPPRAPLGLGLALLPIGTMVLLFAATVAFLELRAELIVVVMLVAATVAGTIAVRRGATWDDLQRAMGEKVADVLPALLILLAIGMLIGTWMASGTIPFLVYWGVRLVDPRYLALTAFLATALMSSFTGTSWGSAGTIGVAMMGTAAALDVPLPLVAGAVVSGAYFGDKMSPLSDMTVLSALSAQADLYRHIRHMLYTAGPSFVLALLLFGTVGRVGDVPAGLPEGARVLLADIEAIYRLGWPVLLPPAVVVFCIVRRVPPALAIALASAVAALVAVLVQGFGVQDAALAAVSGFSLPMIASTGADPAAVSAAFARLAERGGLFSMAQTLVVVFSAFLMTAGMHVAGALDVLMARLLAAARSTFSLIASTMAAGATLVGLTSHGGVTVLVVGGLFQPAYRERGFTPENLSRSLEDSVTLTEVLMPWTVSAVFMATTLGVPTAAYAPWAIFCYGGPVFSLLIAALYSRTRFGLNVYPLPLTSLPLTPSAASRERVTLYTRPGCGLCEKMKAALEARGYPIDEVNIDEDPELTRRYLLEIPVAVRADGSVLAKLQLDD